jgi:iron complex outermembrane receptor protein
MLSGVPVGFTPLFYAASGVAIMPMARFWLPSPHHPISMKTVLVGSARALQRPVALFALSLLWFSSTLSASAQIASSGTITGQIINTDTGEYIRNATVRVEGTGSSVVSEEGGHYRLTNVPAGEAKLVVNYTGYPAAAATVHVAAGVTATHNFELSSTAPSSAADKNASVKLDTYVVSSERVGESKAIMQQRNSQDITNVVSSEQFGDMVAGNIGEFLKNVPGVELDMDRGEAVTVRLRGLPSEYTAVTLDGVSMAHADANGAVAPNTRALNFSSFSLDSLESIEISKTVSADVDANAPAGTINLRPKRAFDRVGRRVVLETHLSAHSDHFEFGRTNGPTDERARKILPGASLQYSDVFFNKRLGINLSLGAHKQFSEVTQVTHTYNYTPTATDLRPIVPTAINFSHTPRNDYRDSVNLTADFKATSNLVLSLGLLYNTTELVTWLRDAIFNLGARNAVLGDNPLVSFTTGANAYAVISPVAVVKRNQSMSAIPKFEYRKGDLRIEGRFMASEALSWYDPTGRAGAVRDLLGGTSLRDTGVTYSGTRSSPYDSDWQITQLGGLDWADGASFANGTAPRIGLERWSKTFSYSGDVTASLNTRLRGVPVVWKAGVKRYNQHRRYRNDNSLGTYSLIGAPTRGGWADYRSPVDYEFRGSGLNAGATSISGGPLWVPDLQQIGALLRDHPERFNPVVSASNYYTAMISERRDLEETIDAAFLMATATVGKAVLRAGFRWEDTTTDVLERDPRTGAEMAAAGYAVEGPAAATPGRASTIAGLDYQYFSKPPIHRIGNYDNYFPSASLKYKFPKDIDLQLGFSSTIRRPTFGNLTGAWVINEPLRRVTAPNRNLGPEKSQNFALRLSKYFEPRGLVAVNFFQNNITGLFRTNELTAEEFGPVEGDYDFTGYTFVTTTQGAGRTTMRGMEIEYNQALSFLPKPLDGFSVRGSYTRTYTATPMPLIIPHSITAGLNYNQRKFSAYANYTWRDAHLQAIGATITRAYRSEGKMDIGGTYKFSQRWSAYFYARNILNTIRVVDEQSGDNPWISYGHFTYGTNWTFGGRYTF